MLIPDENRMVKKSVADGKWIKYNEYDQSIKKALYSNEYRAIPQKHQRLAHQHPHPRDQT